MSLSRARTRGVTDGRHITSAGRIPSAAVGTDCATMQRKRHEQSGFLPSKRNHRENVLLLAAETAHGSSRQRFPPIVEQERPDSAGDMIHIRFRDAEMTLPAGTDADAITAILRSLQQL